MARQDPAPEQERSCTARPRSSRSAPSRSATTSRGRRARRSPRRSARLAAPPRSSATSPAEKRCEPDGENVPSHSAATFLYARRGPLGVVTAITPWNFPITIPAWKIAPALAYRNTVCWKPAEIVPLTAWHFSRRCGTAGCRRVCSISCSGAAPRSVTWSSSRRQSTRSPSPARTRSAGRCSSRRSRRAEKVQLKLGGKNPAVVLGDADLGLAAEGTLPGEPSSPPARNPHGHEPCNHRRDGAGRVHRPPCRARRELAHRRPAAHPRLRVGPLASEPQLRSVEKITSTSPGRTVASSSRAASPRTSAPGTSCGRP